MLIKGGCAGLQSGFNFQYSQVFSIINIIITSITSNYCNFVITHFLDIWIELHNHQGQQNSYQFFWIWYFFFVLMSQAYKIPITSKSQRLSSFRAHFKAQVLELKIASHFLTKIGHFWQYLKVCIFSHYSDYLITLDNMK